MATSESNSLEMEQEDSDSELDEISTDDVEVNIALVGKAGSGISDFVNAIRGEHVETIFTSDEPASSLDSANPNINFPVLPGFDQGTFPAFQSYLKSVEIEKFDAFLIFTTEEFNQWHSMFAKEIESSGKPFFLIRAITPNDNLQEEIDEVKMFAEIKAGLANNIKELLYDGFEIYIISNDDPDKWDFYKLVNAIADSLPPPQKKLFNKISKARELLAWQEFQSFLKETEKKEKNAKVLANLHDTKQLFMKGGVALVQRMMNVKLEGWKDVKINLAILGNSGVGKSSFINAIRGVADGDKLQAAETNVTEATRIPTSFGHPTNSNIRFWDLPGIGTPNYPDLPTFCEKVAIEKYDTYLIICAKRFTDFDLQLSEKVESMGKSFFFVRTKIDNDVRAERRKKGFNEEKMMKKIRDDCVQHLSNFNFDGEEIFLISNHETSKWDFNRLEEAIVKQLPTKQRESLTLSLRTYSKVILKEKIKLLKSMYDDIQGTKQNINEKCSISYRHRFK